MKKFTLSQFLQASYFLFILFALLFGRSFMGLYIFGYRIGELVMGVALLFTLFLILNRNITYKYFNSKTTNLYYILIFFAIISAVLSNSSFLNLYTYKSNSYLLAISFFFISFVIFQKTQISNKLISVLQASLIYVYILSTVSYPSFLVNFFKTYSDKFDYNKASSLAIFFIIVIYITNRTKNLKSYTYGYLFILSGVFLPLFLYKSRGSFLAVLLFIFFEIIFHRKEILQYPIKNLIFFSIALFIFIQSSFDLTDNEFNIQETSSVVNELLDQKNSKIDFLTFFIDNSRLYSTDHNVNWRLQIWQDVLFGSINENKFFLGYGYSDILPAMEIEARRGNDGTNENVHNFLFNMLGRGGIVQVLLYLALISSIYFNKSNMRSYDFLIFVLPIYLISFFDASLENSHFPIIFYSALGFIYKKDFKQYEYSIEENY